MITQLPDGKFQVTWQTATVRLPSGHSIAGRPETVAALTGVESVKATGEVRRVSSNRLDCEKQL